MAAGAEGRNSCPCSPKETPPSPESKGPLLGLLGSVGFKSPHKTSVWVLQIRWGPCPHLEKVLHLRVPCSKVEVNWLFLTYRVALKFVHTLRWLPTMSGVARGYRGSICCLYDIYITLRSILREQLAGE